MKREDALAILTNALRMEGYDAFNLEAKSFKELDIDSLSMVEIAITLENNLDVDFNDKDLAKVKSPKDFIDLLEKTY